METELVEVELADGGTLLVRAEMIGPHGNTGDPTDIGFRDLSFSSISSTLKGIAE